jgi:transposase InsO family protein
VFERRPPAMAADATDATQSAELAVLPGYRLGKGTVDVGSACPYLRSPLCRMGACGQHDTYGSRSQRIRASRKGRPCNELGLSARRLQRPARTFVLPAPPVPDGLTIALLPQGSGEHQDAGIIMPDNGICERFHRTVLDEFYRVAFRKKIYRTVDELKADLDAWIVEYNQPRSHQGRWCFVKTPMQTFLDALPLAKEKLMVA